MGSLARVEIKMVGEWDKLRRLTNKQRLIIHQAGLKGQRLAAGSFKAFIKQRIISGTHGYAPAKSSYLSRKIKAGGQNRLFIYTGAYLKSISIVTTPRGNIAVGIPRNISEQPKKYGGGLPIWQYAQVLEKGSITRGIWPPRPLWRDSYLIWGGRARIAIYTRAALKAAYKLI